MKQNKTNRLLLCLSIGGFAVLAVSFLLMPVEGLGIVPGVLFWGGLLTGVVLQIILDARRKSLFAKYNVERKAMQKVKNGLLSFGSNPAATVADVCLFVSIIATVFVFILTRGMGYLCYVCLSALIFSFCMHCILNGRIYIFVKNQLKVQQVLEQKKASSMKKERKTNE